jgi:hypothetical protein
MLLISFKFPLCKAGVKAHHPSNLSEMRAGAFTTLPLEAVDIEGLRIRQRPELGVHTKNGAQYFSIFHIILHYLCYKI